MSNFVYNLAKKLILDGTLNLLNDTLKVMLVNSNYTPNPDHTYADMGGAADPVDCEVDGANYVRGWGGSGRIVISSKTLEIDNTNDQVKFKGSNPTWAAINVGTIAGAILIKEGASDDTQTVLIAWFDSGFPITTSGSDVTIKWSDNGIILAKNG